MDAERSRIAADLAGLIEGEVHCDPFRLQLFASDASLHQVLPLGVVRPASLQDVVRVVRYASENQITLHARGSGSNVIGGAVGPGLVVDFSCNMRRVLEIGTDSVRVQPGVVLSQLNRDLFSRGRFYAPDPANRSVSTIGGSLGLNLSGSHWKKYGVPRDKVLSLQVVLGSGEVVRIDRPGHVSPPVDQVPANAVALVNLQNRIGQVLQSQRALIASRRPQSEVNQAGYNLFDLGPDFAPDLIRLLVGSEGTLGLITEVTLRTEPLPQHRGVTLLFFDSFDAAIRFGIEVSGEDIAACDLLDRRLLTLAREAHLDTVAALVPPAAEAMLLIEQQRPSDGELRTAMEQLSQRATRRRKGAIAVRSTTQVAERNRYWRLTRRVVPTLYQLQGDQRAVPLVEDCAVAPARLPALFQGLHQLLNQHEVTAATFVHVPQGVVQVYPFLNPASADDQRLMTRLATAVADLVIAMGGSISGSTGDGLNRTWLLRRQYGPLYDLFVEVKNIFDPQHLLNPGKVVDQPQWGLTDQLRPTMAVTSALSAAGSGGEDAAPPAKGALPVLVPELVWKENELELTSRNCNGCARCRTQSPEQRMCPMYRIGPREEASPRAKANLMRGLLTGTLPPESVTRDEFRSIADLCFNCHQCRLECPASVDIPRLMVEAKAQYVAVNGLKLSDWLLSRLDLLYWFAGLMPGLTNQLLGNRMARWLLDRVTGIAQGRKLPKFSRQNFIGWSVRQKLHRSRGQKDPKVVFFVDAFVNWNDLELGQALVKVLQHNGVEVVVPQNQAVSGMSLISDGVLARARSLASRNVELLSEYVRAGYEIVTTEPSAALALRREYVHLLDDPDAALVGRRVHDACDYLWKLHQQGKLELDFRTLNVTVGYHQPCHQKALGNGIPGVQLLRLIPGVQVSAIEQGCSGMAGTFGLKRKNWLRSLRIGRGLINAVRNPEIMAGSTECTTCRIQMEQGTAKPTIHPVKILALAYGLMPQLENLFKRRSGELHLS